MLGHKPQPFPKQWGRWKKHYCARMSTLPASFIAASPGEYAHLNLCFSYLLPSLISIHQYSFQQQFFSVLSLFSSHFFFLTQVIRGKVCTGLQTNTMCEQIKATSGKSVTWQKIGWWLWLWQIHSALEGRADVITTYRLPTCPPRMWTGATIVREHQVKFGAFTVTHLHYMSPWSCGG